MVWGSRPKPCTRFREVPKEWNRFRSEGSIHETLGSERFRSEGSIHETLGSERFRSEGSIHETLGSERFRSEGSIHETLGSERFRSEGSIHETLGSERFRSQGSIHETLGSERFRSEGSIHEMLGSERFRSEGSIHETLGSERFRSEGSVHETLGSERFRSEGSIHETLGHFSKYGMCLPMFAYNMFCVSHSMFFVSHSMFSVTHNMSKRKTVPVHQLLGFSHGLIFWVVQAPVHRFWGWSIPPSPRLPPVFSLRTAAAEVRRGGRAELPGAEAGRGLQPRGRGAVAVSVSPFGGARFFRGRASGKRGGFERGVQRMGKNG